MTKILAIDGGGIRGLIPAIFLAKIEETVGKPIYEMFDLIAGTSTGGILALGLSMPGQNDKKKAKYRAEDLIKLYSEEGKNIFSRSLAHKILSLGGINDEKYTSDGIEHVLMEYFGNTKLSESLASLIIPSYEIELRTPFFFKSEKAKIDNEYDFFMWEIARATSGAPTYFEPYKLKTSGNKEYYSLIDGGVYANNPAMCALAQVKATDESIVESTDSIKSKYTDDVLLISIGTGELVNSMRYEEVVDWGLINWARPILDVVFDGVSKTVDYQLRQILKDRYYRFQVNLAQFGSDSMDDASDENIHQLKVAAEKMVNDAENDGRLNKLCNLLK